MQKREANTSKISKAESTGIGDYILWRGDEAVKKEYKDDP